jgi:hypothetical protein
MKAMLPIFCRPLGYLVLALGLFAPFVLALMGRVNDNNLIFYKECSKLLWIIGALMILLAFTKDESEQTEKIRIRAMRQAVFITALFIFIYMLYHVSTGKINFSNSASFIVFLVFNVVCLEFGLIKSRVDKHFKR